jgi:hypothetical protein
LSACAPIFSMLEAGQRAIIENGVALAEEFRQRATELNRRILTYNLKSPSTHFHMRTLAIELEIAALS